MRIARISPWLLIAALAVPAIGVFFAMGYFIIGIPVLLMLAALGGGALASYIHED